MWFFTADEHYNHAKIIEYCNRPFESAEEMNDIMIQNHNRVVTAQDVTVHVGDFGWFKNATEARRIIRWLNGSHVFIKGSHDGWLPQNHRTMWRKHIDGQFIVCCHYAMRTWERAYYGAWNLYGHSHGQLLGAGKQLDVGVDCHKFYPVSFQTIKTILDAIPKKTDLD